MFNNNADLAELAGDIAITLYDKRLVYRYDQQKRKGFLTILIQNAINRDKNGNIKFNRPYSLEDLQNIDKDGNFEQYCRGIFTYNQNSCDCSSFVAAVWYLTFLFAKTNINFTYGIGDDNNLSTHYVYRNKPIKLDNFNNTYTTFNIAEFFQNYGFECITDANFTKNQLQKGDILVRNLNDTQNGGRIGHAAICIGEYNNYNPAMIQCVGSSGLNGQPSDLNIGYKSPHECALSCDPVDYFFNDNILYNNSNDRSFVLRIKHNRRKKGQDISLNGSQIKDTIYVTSNSQFLYRNTALVDTTWAKRNPIHSTAGTFYVVGNLQNNEGIAEVGIPLPIPPQLQQENIYCSNILINLNQLYFSYENVVGIYLFCLSPIDLSEAAPTESFKQFKQAQETARQNIHDQTESSNIADSEFSDVGKYVIETDTRNNVEINFTNFPSLYTYDNNNKRIYYDTLYLYLYFDHTELSNYHLDTRSNIEITYIYKQINTIEQDNNDDTNG